MCYLATKSDFVISTDKNKIDITYVHRFLSGSYWSPGIPVQTVAHAIEGSLCFGVYDTGKQTGAVPAQVGFARMITDGATFAYLADVFIDPDYRGKGLSKWLLEVIMAHPSLQGLRRILLATKDAHGLYKKVGFIPLANPEVWMQIHNADVYKTK